MQDAFKNQVAALGPNLDFNPTESYIDLIVGSADFLVTFESRTQPMCCVLMAEKSNFKSELKKLSKITPFKVIDPNDESELQMALNSFSLLVHKKKTIENIKIEFSKKRRELELLTKELNVESAQQIEYLEKSHIEEARKNANEKSLLHFLDFVQSESLGEDFLFLLTKFLWRDLKKMDRFVQVGFCFQNFSSKSQVFSYNGVTESTFSADVDFSSTKAASQLASALGRPVGTIQAWSMVESKKTAHFFVENISASENMVEYESYIKERMALISLYLDRWLIEKEYESLLDRWDRTFRSFSGFVHVIDDDYNLYQANYLSRKEGFVHSQCFRMLAHRDSPCPQCPLKSKGRSSFFLRDGVRVEANVSEFDLNGKKYFFVIYDDVTQTHHLKSQMIQSEKMSTLGRLGNHLAHELNNPLTGIKSYVETLLVDQQLQLAPNMKSDLTEILKATVRCQNIIRNFLNFSHSQKRTFEKVALVDLVQNTLQLLKSATRPHRLFVDIKPQLAVMAYSQDLQQVIFNLIKNACQAMNSNGVIKVFTQEVNGQIELIIEDSGPGFDAETAKHAFEPFYTTKKKGEGTGLGLYLSKKLIQNMKGDLVIDRLPKDESTSGPSEASRSGARMKILFPAEMQIQSKG